MMTTLNDAHAWVSSASSVLLALIAIPLGLTLLRMLRGPTYADRFVALDMLTGLAVTAAALAASSSARREFLDVGLGLAVFGFVGTCALAAFLERRAGGRT